MSDARSSNRRPDRGPGAASRDRPVGDLVLGTAGHIDHGKTSLVRALTGVDTDRLPQEKARGITIELGFAPLELGEDVRVGVVDVPGHERFVRTMVAGATGIDLVMLVVAADEGVMPQTREHLAVCRLLGVERGVVALSRLDLADAETAELAAEEVRELLAGTGLEGAETVGVSARSGEGLQPLREALGRAARSAPPRTPRAGPARLSVDRVFARRGFGAVVTGTVTGAGFALGEAVEIHPTGRRARIRGLERFGQPAERVEAGSRCAVNLQGMEVAELARGMVLATPGALAPTRCVDVELCWLPEAPGVEGAAAVALLAGTWERRARLAPIGSPRLAPGARGLARLHLEGEPVALLPGDRFVVRGFTRTRSGGATLGGGRVLDVAPPHRRVSDAALVAELERLAAADAAEGLRLRVERAGFTGLERDRLRRETGLGEDRLDALLARARADGALVGGGSAPWLGPKVLEVLEARALRALETFHREEPLRPGMSAAALRGALPENAAPAADLVLATLRERGRIVEEEEQVRLPHHTVVLSPRQQAIAAQLRADATAAGLEPPTPREWSQAVGMEPAELRELLAHLERDGSLVRAPGDLWFDRVRVDELRERVVAHLLQQGSLDTRAYKGLIGTTRKYAVPLMELFDAQQLTRREGERRVLRRHLPRPQGAGDPG